MAKVGKKAFKAPKWKAKAIVKGKATRKSIRKAADISSKAIEAAIGKDHAWSKEASLIPYDVAALLTDPCGVMYYNNRRDQAAEYRPFFEDELSTLQAKLNMCKHAILGLAGAIETNADEIRAEIGFNQEMILQVIRTVKTGSNYLASHGPLRDYYVEEGINVSDLQMAHDFIYGDGITWGPLEDLINSLSGDIRGDAKDAINALESTMREADQLLKQVEALYAAVYHVYGEVVEAIEDLVYWNGNALKLARNFCSEANEVAGYINKREQQFRGVNDRERRGGFGYDRPKFWRPFNEPCDRWCRSHETRTDCQEWPSWYDDAHEAKIKDRTHGMWPAYPTYRGCGKNSAGTYTCGEYGKQDVRALVRYITSDLPDQVEALLNYDADALFRDSKNTMNAAKRAIEKSIRTAGVFRNVLDNAATTTLMVAASSLCTPIFWSDCYDSLDEYRDKAVKGLTKGRVAMFQTKSELNSAITGHTAAKAVWTSPSTPWRMQANVYLATLRNQHELIQAPWKNDIAVEACKAVFPEVPMSCLDKMIPASCGRIDISLPEGPKVIDSDMTYRVWDTDSAGGGADDLLGSDKLILDKETEFGSYGAYGFQPLKTGFLSDIKLWHVVVAATVGVGLYTWSKSR